VSLWPCGLDASGAFSFRIATSRRAPSSLLRELTGVAQEDLRRYEWISFADSLGSAGVVFALADISVRRTVTTPATFRWRLSPANHSLARHFFPRQPLYSCFLSIFFEPRHFDEYTADGSLSLPPRQRRDRYILHLKQPAAVS
ncbi:unnamed protein product, partial [Ectocarpus sp. 12 AP-2014]